MRSKPRSGSPRGAYAEEAAVDLRAAPSGDGSRRSIFARYGRATVPAGHRALSGDERRVLAIAGSLVSGAPDLADALAHHLVARSSSWKLAWRVGWVAGPAGTVFSERPNAGPAATESEPVQVRCSTLRHQVVRAAVWGPSVP